MLRNKQTQSGQLVRNEISPSSDINVDELRKMVEETLTKSSAKQLHLNSSDQQNSIIPLRDWAVDFTDLGYGVSTRHLNAHLSDKEKLASFNLPILDNPHDLASMLGIPSHTLRWMAFDACKSKYCLYYTFPISKKNGGERIISAPCLMLKQAQKKILRQIVDNMPCESAAHGFVKGCSPLTNAIPHVGKGTVINVDLKDFFPNIHLPMVAFVFTSYGYSPSIATILALVCTTRAFATTKDPVTDEVSYIFNGKRALPQGAPTSPGIANQIARRLDKRLQGFASKIGWTYTRYADDITFSGPKLARREAQKVLDSIVSYITDSGFKPHPEKRKIVTQGGRQRVTGYNVNEKVSVPREYRQDVRRTLYFAQRNTLIEQHKEEIVRASAPHDLGKWLLSLNGRIAFIRTAHSDLGRKLHRQLFSMIGKEQLLPEYYRARHGVQDEA
jgi:RNA-directed DNA polymerase